MKRLSLKALVPNLITLSGLSFGLSSIRFAIEGNYSLAVICILFAGVCDALDGMLARYLDSESDLGFQLDSLSDFLSFGIAPGILIYMAIFYYEDSNIGVFATLIFIIFSCLRLALFNVLHENSKNTEIERIDFFIGIQKAFMLVQFCCFFGIPGDRICSYTSNINIFPFRVMTSFKSIPSHKTTNFIGHCHRLNRPK